MSTGSVTACGPKSELPLASCLQPSFPCLQAAGFGAGCSPRVAQLEGLFLAGGYGFATGRGRNQKREGNCKPHPQTQGFFVRVHVTTGGGRNLWRVGEAKPQPEAAREGLLGYPISPAAGCSRICRALLLGAALWLLVGWVSDRLSCFFRRFSDCGWGGVLSSRRHRNSRSGSFWRKGEAKPQAASARRGFSGDPFAPSVGWSRLA